MTKNGPTSDDRAGLRDLSTPSPKGDPTPPPVVASAAASTAAASTAVAEVEQHDLAVDSYEAPEIEVTFFHGSFDRCDHPVMLGHYTATPIAGAEGFADRQYDGRLSERMAWDQYPDEVGESLLVRPPRRRHPAEGVIIVGLGEYGELTELRFVEAIRAALVRHALDEADDHNRPGPLELGIGSVLLGCTGDNGLRVSGSVRGIVNGVREANRDLSGGDRPVRAFYSKLQIWEWNAAEAELAYRTLVVPSSTAEGGDGRHAANDVRPTLGLKVADGALMASAPTETVEPAWWHVRVTGAERGADEPDLSATHLTLKFSIDGRLARTSEITHNVERRTLDRLLRSAVGTSRPKAGIHTTMFEVLFPKQLKWDLMAAQHIQLEVDAITADIPWEMLSARNPSQGTRGQLALRAPFIRRLALGEGPIIRRATQARALVIGNPPLGKHGAPLPGAYRESMAVAKVLENDAAYAGKVRTLCFDAGAPQDDSTTTAIETALFDDDYRIIHIAAHGRLDPDDPTRTGVAIGPDEFITAATFHQLNVTPDLVFLNCCHLAVVGATEKPIPTDYTGAHLNALGASLARQLVGAGVRAVVVAGWAVDDKAAERFAQVFYEFMLRGATFGQAVYEARHEAQNTSPEHSTWGAYQCYGDRGYTLPASGPRAGSGTSKGSRIPPLTVREALRRVETLVGFIESVGVKSSHGPNGTTALDELDLLVETAAERGWCDGPSAGPFCEQIGRALAALGDYEQAIKWHRKALAANDGRVMLRTVEELVNLMDRLATRLARLTNRTPADQQRADDLIKESMESIQLLEKLSKSGERIALRAGHLKRRATALLPEDRAEPLAAAAATYRESYELRPSEYALFNYVALEEIRCRLAGETSLARDLYPEMELALETVRRASTDDYWGSVAQADGLLTASVKDDEIESRSDEIVEAYICAFDTRSTALQRMSTIDHVLDLADLHPDAASSAALRSIHERLVAANN